MILKFDSSRKVEYDGKEYNVPMVDEAGNEIEILMDEENMKFIIDTGVLILTDNCDNKIN